MNTAQMFFEDCVGPIIIIVEFNEIRLSTCQRRFLFSFFLFSVK